MVIDVKCAMNNCLKQEKKAFKQMTLFVRSQLDKLFETCGITCRDVIETDICGIIGCWTFESECPRTPAQRRHIREELERITEQLPYAGFDPHLSKISFPGAGVRLVHFELYPCKFNSIKARFEEIRRRAIECPERAGAWWLNQYVILAEEYWQIREQLVKDYEFGCGFIPRDEVEAERWRRKKRRDWSKILKFDTPFQESDFQDSEEI